MLVSVILVIVIVIAAVVIKCQKGNNQNSLKTINVSEVTRSVFYAPQYVAINNGYFEEKGLEIELSTGQGADAVMTSVLANQVEIGFAGLEASIYVYNEEKKEFREDHPLNFKFKNKISTILIKDSEKNIQLSLASSFLRYDYLLEKNLFIDVGLSKILDSEL